LIYTATQPTDDIYQHSDETLYEVDRPHWLRLTHTWLRTLEERLSEISMREENSSLAVLLFHMNGQYDQHTTESHRGLLITLAQLRELIQIIQDSHNEAALTNPLPDCSSPDQASISRSSIQPASAEIENSAESQYNPGEGLDHSLVDGVPIIPPPPTRVGK